MPCTNHPDAEDGLALCVRCARPFCPSCHVVVGGLIYCGPCKEQLVLDLRSGRAATGLAIASPGRRFVAILLDSLILAIPMWTLMLALVAGGAVLGASGSIDETLAGFGIFAFQLILVAISLLSTFLYEWLMLRRFGWTLGKRALRLHVVTPQGQRISSGQAAGRAAIKQLFGLLSCFGLIDYIPAFFTAEATAVHDMVANCRVVDWSGDDE